jgi:hypothetical protein
VVTEMLLLLMLPNSAKRSLPLPHPLNMPYLLLRSAEPELHITLAGYACRSRLIHPTEQSSATASNDNSRSKGCASHRIGNWQVDLNVVEYIV